MAESSKQPGVQRPKRSRKLLAFLLMTLVAVIALGVGPSLYESRKRSRILRSGEAATATVLSVTDTGNRYNHNPEVEMVLEVQREGMPSYHAVVTWVVSQVEVGNYRQGVTVNVRVDRDAPDDVVVVGVRRERGSP
jgi:hypothetical protein